MSSALTMKNKTLVKFHRFDNGNDDEGNSDRQRQKETKKTHSVHKIIE